MHTQPASSPRTSFYPSEMIVTVNGTPTDLPDPTTIRQLIERMGLGKAACAAEVNKALVPKREHLTTELKPGDTVELVSLVGGG